MGFVTVQGSDLIEFHQFSVHSDLSIASLAHLFKEFLVVSLSASDYRCEQIAFPSCIVLHDEGDDLLVSVSDHFLAGLWRICRGSPCKQETEEVIDLGDRAHCRTWVVSCSLLLNCDDRAKSCNGFNLRLFEDSHEVLGVCGKGVHIPPLPFCIYGVEGKG